jgi:hypothetical protein
MNPNPICDGHQKNQVPAGPKLTTRGAWMGDKRRRRLLVGCAALPPRATLGPPRPHPPPAVATTHTARPRPPWLHPQMPKSTRTYLFKQGGGMPQLAGPAGAADLHAPVMNSSKEPRASRTRPPARSSTPARCWMAAAVGKGGREGSKRGVGIW